MAISLNKENYGDLIDPFGGIAHLAKKMIQIPARSRKITFSGLSVAHDAGDPFCVTT